jgi:hypothetical protein
MAARAQTGDSRPGPRRRENLRLKLLRALAAAGDAGLTGYELFVVAGCGSRARLTELRRAGHAISVTREAVGVWRYRLQQRELFSELARR